MPDRIAVFLDYQNVHLGAHEVYRSNGQREHSIVHPLALAERIVAKRKFGGELTSVRVFRGRPRPDLAPKPAAANDAQTAAWQRDERVVVPRRTLNYRGYPQQKPQEKGIDVALSIDLVRAAIEEQADVLIAFTSDTDILPALEFAFYRPGPRVEIAAWAGGNRALWFPEEKRNKRLLPYCHFLDKEDFEAVRDPTIYI